MKNPLSLPAKALDEKGMADIRAVVGKFSAEVPAQARAHGHYTPRPGEFLADETIAAPNGIYRVRGSHWLLEVKAGAVKEISRAVPPHFGGKGVIGIPN